MGNSDVELVSSHCAAIRWSSIVVFLILLFVNFITLVTCSANNVVGGVADDHRHQSRVDLAELRHNIIKGLKLKKLPDMTKVDISNNEFHRKYLEYFRRLYKDDESEYNGSDDNDDATTIAGYDNDVSAIQVPGLVKHDRPSSPPPTNDDEEEFSWSATIAFPVDSVTTGNTLVIRSVARIYGQWRDVRDVATKATDVRVRVYGRILVGNSGNERPALVADHTWTAIGSSDGRWTDVDVTNLLPRSSGSDVTLELTVKCRTADGAHKNGGTMRFDDENRPATLHVFLDGPSDDGTGRREKRDRGKRLSISAAFRASANGGGRRGSRRHGSGGVRRTDCKAETAPGSGTSGAAVNGTVAAERNKCCREQMRVVFADIPGFDFIVEPKWFDAGLCRGRCPAKYNPATRHAFIQSLLWKLHNNGGGGGGGGGGASKKTPDERTRRRRRVRHRGAAAESPPPPPKPCCAPSKLDQLQIIHYDETNPTSLKVTTWKEMAVVECACS